MKRWIAHEHDETGRPTDACVIVSAHTQITDPAIPTFLGFDPANGS